MAKKKTKGNPWKAARARVFYDHGQWRYVVTNWHGKVVESDMAGGGAKGRNTIFTQAARAVEAHRHIDGIGQGHHLHEKHVWQPDPSQMNRNGMAEATWPELFPPKRRKYYLRSITITPYAA
jgi:hypothetical protein